MTFLTSPLSQLKGAGPKVLEKLAKLELKTFVDLLFHLPLHYQDRTHVISIRDLRVKDYAVIEGVIDDIQLAKGRKQSLMLSIDDGTRSITLRFFHFNQRQLDSFQVGTKLRCFGEARHGRQGLEMVHPEYRIIKKGEQIEVQETLTPIYPSTEGLNQATIRNLSTQILPYIGSHIFPDWIPETLREEFRLPHIADAIRFVHQPTPDASREQLEQGKHPAQQRLAFEELLAHQISLRKLRRQSDHFSGPSFQGEFSNQETFLSNLSFQLTGAQNRVLKEIFQDLHKSVPMMRLVQGDVGSGKTIVAALAMLNAVDHGFQAVLMAPTDLLAEQHYRNLEKWMEPLGLSIAWLAGKHKGKAREKTLASIASGESKMIIGTHAVFQEDVLFAQLGLIVVDEQHRFGVHQRLALREKGVQNDLHPHQLVMTATPIPRTLAMTFYADLDVSVIDELPPGRTPVKTVAIANDKRLDVIKRIYQACLEQRQVYWVCTLIEESEFVESQAAQDLAEDLKKHLPDVRIGLVHGRLKAQEKEDIMHAFKAHELDVLVATTVIEVGVDVPNASLMIIENAERLGLSQLHQLRGRVGRGSTESFCVLLYQSPLSETARKRLDIMRQTNDGFEIAKHDLEIRGPGELLGSRQTGAIRYRIADLQRDQFLLPQVQKLAEILLSDFPQEADAIIERWLPRGEELARV